MKKTKRSAFTIVELVIVIAVIAILSAVLIPTFGGIIKNANVAADQATAATLTSELHVFLMGERIDSEEELMKALGPKYDGGSGIGEKLVPKAGSYGQHFWFDMENQMIISATYGEILSRGEESASVESGIQLMSLTRDVSSINVSFREIAKKGYFFIDNRGSAIAELLNDIDEIEDDASYNAVISSLNTLAATIATEDTAFAELLANTIKTTAIVTESYATAPAGATGIYFEPGIKNIRAGGSLANLSSGTIVLPSTVQMVATGSLVFGGTGENVTLVTSLADANHVSTVFANGSTNAIIKTADGNFKLRNEDGSFSETANKLFGDDGIMDDVVVESKLPYADFDLFFKDVESNNSIAHITDGDVHNVYINYGYYAGTGRTFQIWLRPDEGADVPATNELITWNSNNDKVQVSETGLVTISADVDTTSAPVVITATAKGLSGNDIESSVNVYMDVLESTSISFADQTYSISEGNENTFVWTYTDNSSYTFTIDSVIYSFGKATLGGNPTLDISTDDNYFSINNYTLDLVMDGTSPAASGKTVPVTLTLDGVVNSTLNIKVEDNRKTAYKTAFRWNSKAPDSNNAIRYYYVGNDGAINLSDIATYDTFEAGTLTVNGYSQNGLYRPIDHEIYEPDGLSATITGTEGSSLAITSADQWNSTKITFAGKSPSSEDAGIVTHKPIVIEIKPNDTAKASTLIELVLVDATNVYSTDALVLTLGDGTTEGKSAVMFADITVTDSKTSDTKFEVGSKSLYGNGYKITAKDYAASKNADSKYKTEEYLINLSEGGKIENIYLVGPVYTQLQYNTAAMSTECGQPITAYYTTGIKMTGNCTLSNSYASGFRQPVQVYGDSSTKSLLDNVTLYGGNFANLSIMSGDVKLNNVTTVQEVQEVVKGGTFNTSTKSKYTLGAGIVVETSAFASNITISGKLMQYNWIKQGEGQYLGSDIAVRVHKYSMRGEYIDQYVLNPDYASLTNKYLTDDGNGTKYFNTSIVYMMSEHTLGGDPKYTASSITGECKFENTDIELKRIMSTSLVAARSVLYTKSQESGGIWTTAYSLLNSMITSTYDGINVAAHIWCNSNPSVAPGATFSNSNNYYVGYGNK